MKGFNHEEQQIIGDTPSAGIMRVLKTNDPVDSKQLRQLSEPLTTEDLQTDIYTILKSRMLETVKDPESPGVGIAAPQVGVMKQLIAVERYDREEPVFEFYVNPNIEKYAEEKAIGAEGCLSVPERSESILRSEAILISYLDEKSGERVAEVVAGYTAVIFQHEIDHLNGILYIDRFEQQESIDEPGQA